MLSLFHIDQIGDRDIICFGAGVHGQVFIKNWNISFMEYNILYFADSDEKKWGTKIFGNQNEFYQNGIDIISVNDLKKICLEKPEILIVITAESYGAIYSQLIREGIANDIISEQEFMAIMKGELMEQYLLPFSEFTGFDITRVYQHGHGWGFVDDRTIVYIRQFLEAYYKGKECCVLLSPPKTGNTTIAVTAEKYGIKILNNHVLTGYYLFENESCRRLFCNFVPKIIIGVREPIAQYISTLFSYITLGLAPLCQTEWKDAQKIFERVFLTGEGKNDYLGFAVHNENAGKNGIHMGCESLFADQFMDEEGQLNQWLGIDLYAYGFDKKRGYSIFECKRDNGNIQQILFYKLEKMDELEDVFRDFLGLEEFKFEKGNVGEEKYYADRYKEFKENFKIPKEYVDKLYNSRFMRYCYDDEEIEAFRKKWAKNICDLALG